MDQPSAPARSSHLWVALLGQLLVIAALVIGWIAIGQLATTTERTLQRNEDSLASVGEIANSSGEIVVNLRETLALVGNGLGQTATAVQATRTVSANVRSLLDTISFIGRVDDLNTSLQEAEASLDDVRRSLVGTSVQIGQATPSIDAAERALSAVPGEIRASITEIRAARDQINGQRNLWRLALVCAAGALLLMFWEIGRLSRRSSAQAGPKLGQP
jgi:hypothetical protein